MSAPVDIEAVACQELVELVTDYLESALTTGELQRFEQHLSACGKCQQYLAQLRATIAATGTVSQADLTQDAEAALLQVFRGWRDSVPSAS